MELFTRVPKQFLKVEDYYYLVEVISKSDDKNVWFIDHLIRRIPDIELDVESEIDKLLDVIIFKIQHYENLYMHCEFFKIIHDNYNSLFLKFLKKIEKIYLYFDNQRRHFDYDLEVLKIILTYNPKFITDLLKYNYDQKDYLSMRDFDNNDFERLWELDNYEVVFDNMIDYLVRFKRIFLHRASEISKAFKGYSPKEIDFLNKKLIATKDNKMIELIFNIVTTIYRDKMLDFLKIILEKDCDIELFKRLDFYTSAGVTMGSRLPNLQFELTQYEKVLKFLHDQKDIKYLNFIEIIERNIMYAKASIERERREEFISEWD